MKWLVWLTLVVVLALVLRIVVPHVRYERATFHPAKGPSSHPALGPESWRLMHQSKPVSGWYKSGSLGHVVILSHGSLGKRDQLNDEMLALHKRGFSVVAFDFPGHGESGGSVDCLGQPEVLEQVVAHTRTLEPQSRVSLLGFSMGGFATSVVASRDAKIHKVVLLGTFADALTQTVYEHGSGGFLAQQAALWTDRFYGLDLSKLRPIEHLAKVDHPVMIVHGEDDLVIPLAEAKALLAASKRATLVTVPKVGHGGYLRAAGGEGTLWMDFLLRADEP